MESIKIGDRVRVLGEDRAGEVAFIGETHFSDGTWLGIILDEAKGKNDGSVDGKRYFNCSKNHGVFARPSKLEKADSSSNKSVHKCRSTVLSRNYPNYLKASSKLKAKNALCDAKDIGTRRSQFHFNRNHQTVKNASFAIDKNSKLKEILEEKEQLRNKLQTAEETLQQLYSKYKKAEADIKRLVKDNESKNKLIKNLKLNLKLRKMQWDDSNDFQETDPLDTSNKKRNQGKNNHSIKEQQNFMTNDGYRTSDDELDFENIKALTSIPRIVELEEENRIMMEGLVELREFLRTKCQSPNINFGSPQIESFCDLNKEGQSCSYFVPVETTTPMKNRVLNTMASESQKKGYSEVLREMVKFNEIMSRKRNLKKVYGTKKSFLDLSGKGCSPHKEHTAGALIDKLLESQDTCAQNAGCSTEVACVLEDCKFPKDFSAFDEKNYRQTANFQSSQQVSKPMTEIGNMYDVVNDGKRQKSETIDEELWKTMPVVVSSPSGDLCHPSTSETKEDYLIEFPESSSDSEQL